MNSARISFDRNKHEEDLTSSESEDESSSSSSSSGSSSSSSSRLSSSAGSPANSDDEAAKTPKVAVTTVASPKSDGTSKATTPVASTDKSGESKATSSAVTTKTSPKPSDKSPPSIQEVNTKTTSKDTELKQDEKKTGKYSKLAEEESQPLEAKKSKIPSLGTGSASKKIEPPVETKPEELPNLSAKKSTAKKPIEKVAVVEEGEPERPKESSGKASKIPGVKEKITKSSTADEGDEDDSKVDSGRISKKTPENFSTKISDRVSKFSSGTLRKFETRAEEKEEKEDAVRKPLEKLPGSKLKKATVTADESLDQNERSSTTATSVSKKTPAAEKTSDDQSVDSEKSSKIPKFKKSSDKSLISDKESALEDPEKPEKLSSVEKEKKPKEAIEDDEVEKVTKVKVGKKKKVSSEENCGTEDDGKKNEVTAASDDSVTRAGLTPEVNSTNEKVKKRKKSPAKEVVETAEKEDEKKTPKSLVSDPVKPSEEEEEDNTNKEQVLSSNKLSVDRAEPDTVTKVKKGSKRSSKSPTPVSEATTDDKPPPEASENIKKPSSEIVSNAQELANTSEDTTADVQKDTSTKKEENSVKPSEDKIKESVALKEDLSVVGESIAKETAVQESDKNILHAEAEDSVGDEAGKTEKKRDIAVEVLGDTKEISIKALVPEVPEKPSKESAMEETDPAESAASNKPEIIQTKETCTLVRSDLADLSSIAGAEESKEAEDDEFKSTAKQESVDDFIQRILSEVRNSDQKLKDMASERAEAELEASADQKEDLGDEVRTKIQTKEVEDEDKITAKPPTVNRPTGLEEPPTRGDADEGRIRSRYPADEEEELAILAKYFGKKSRKFESDFQDLDASEELDNRSSNAAEIMRRRRTNQDYDFEGNDYAPYARTMAGPKVSKRNFQRYNFGESDFDGKEEGYVSRCRRERGALPEEAFMPRRNEETSEVVRQKSRGVRTLVEKQAEVVDAVKRASKGLDDLEKEILGVKQLSLGRRSHVEDLENAFEAEARTYENEYQAASESQGRRHVQSSRERKEDFQSLMFGPKPTYVDPGVDAFSTPAVASFMNIYGSSVTSRGPEMVNGVLDQRLPRDFTLEADNKVGSRFGEYLAFERRLEAGGRRENGRENGRELDASASTSSWKSSASGISVDTSASDEFLNRVRSKYPILSSSSVNEPTGSSRLADISSMSGFLGNSSDAPWSSRGVTRGTELSSRSANSGYSSGSFLPSDSSNSWRERGSNSRRSTNFGDGLSGPGENNWRRSGGGSDTYLGRSSLSSGSRSRRS